MSAARKNLPGPSVGPDLTALLRNRHVQTGDDDQAATHTPAQSQTQYPSTDDVVQSLADGLGGPQPADALIAQTAAKPKAPKAKRPEMDRRSWYMPKETADVLAAAVEELHWETRQPKHVVLKALIDTALAHRAEVVRRLGSH